MIPDFQPFAAALGRFAPAGEATLYAHQTVIGAGFINGDINDAHRWLGEGTAVYANCSSVVVPPSGNALRRRKVDCRTALCLVLDDVTSAPVQPSWWMETSAGNFQAGYLLFPTNDLSLLEAVQRNLAGRGLTDPGAGGCNRLIRVPGSTNLKPGRNGFRSTLREWKPELVRYLEVLAVECRIDIASLEREAIDTTDDADSRDDSVDDVDPAAVTHLIDVGRRMRSPNASFGGAPHFTDLHDANPEVLGRKYPDSNRDFDSSRAQAAYLSHAAFLTGKNPALMDAMLRASALCNAKWLEREDYRRRSIEGAIRMCKATYTGAPAATVGLAVEPIDPIAAVAHQSTLEPEYDRTEDNAALRLVASFGGTARYVADWGAWLVFDGALWRADNTLAMFDRSRAVCRDLATSIKIDPGVTEAARQRLVAKFATAQTVAAVERLARADRAVAATVDIWDGDRWALNTPAGLLDLRTAVIRPGAPSDYCTKSTAVGPGPDATPPTWLRFLHDVTGGDRTLMDFLQRMTGYALTGLTREHAMFFLYGTGGNGKSVFLSALTALLGSYATVAAVDAFTESRFDRHSTELAALRGARLVVAQETQAGRRWDEARVKSITGGDPITARFMRQDNFTFTPDFKLLIAGNHRPGLRTVDEAIRRRLHLVPFSTTIPASHRDPHLAEKLRAEWPGILAWAVQGCIEWQRHGLQPPASVMAATDTYLRDEDVLRSWIEDCCVIGPDQKASIAELYACAKLWFEQGGEYMPTKRRFASDLESRGFVRDRLSGGAKGHRGISIKIITPPTGA